jgi:hypothetical protein
MQPLQQSQSILAGSMVLTGAVYAYTLLPPDRRSSSDDTAAAGFASYGFNQVLPATDSGNSSDSISNIAATAAAAAAAAAQQQGRFAWQAAAAAARAPRHLLQRQGFDLLVESTGVSMQAVAWMAALMEDEVAGQVADTVLSRAPDVIHRRTRALQQQ